MFPFCACGPSLGARGNRGKVQSALDWCNHGAVQTLEDRLAADVAEHVDSWVDRIVRAVSASLPAMVAGDTAADLAAASSRALLAEFVRSLAGGEDRDRLRAPSPALGFARYLARAEASLAGLLRSYRLGQEMLFDRAAELADVDDVAGLRRVGLLTFRFVDAVVDEVTGTFEQEREAFLRGSALRRERLVARLLAGEPHGIAEVETTLGWRMAGTHVATVVWSEVGLGDASTSLLRAVFTWLGDPHGLAMPGPASEWYGWTTAESEPGTAPGELREALAAIGARVAVGEPGKGLQGFIASRRQADAARRMARYLPDETVVRHRDVALLHLLLADAPAASAFAKRELGELSEPQHAGLRTTARSYLENGSDTTAAAAALGLHRNTVMRRIERASALLGAPVDHRAREVHAALLVRDALGDVLAG